MRVENSVEVSSFAYFEGLTEIVGVGSTITSEKRVLDVF